MEWHWETQKKLTKVQVVQPNGSSWVKLAQVGQVEQVEAGLQIYVGQVDQEQGGLQIDVEQVLKRCRLLQVSFWVLWTGSQVTNAHEEVQFWE